MFHTARLLILSITFMFALNACTSMPSDFEEPSVTVTSFTPVPSSSMSPEFDIILHVTNPNREPLELEGMSYTVHLDGNKVLSGVSNNLPVIPAYGEADVNLKATANLFGSLQLLTGLMNQSKDNMVYEFNAKLDAGTFIPNIIVNKKGKLSFNQPQ